MTTDPFERLREYDPAQSYAPHDVEAMISRVLLGTAPSRPSVLTSFKVRMAGAVAAAGALSVAAVTVLSGLAAPSFATLSLSATRTSAHGAGSATPTMMICRWCLVAPYTFRAVGLSQVASSSPVYVLAGPDPASTAQVLSNYLSLSSATTTNPTPGVVEVTTSTTTMDVSGAAVGSLYISDSTGLNVPGAPGPDAHSLEVAVQNTLAATSIGYQLLDPHFSVTAAHAGNGAAQSEDVSYSVAIDTHVVDNLSVSATFDAQGRLLNLSAPLFTVASNASYPTLSPAGGVDTLNAEAAAFRAQQVAASGPTGTASVPPTSVGGTSPGGAAPTVSTPTGSGSPSVGSNGTSTSGTVSAPPGSGSASSATPPTPLTPVAVTSSTGAWALSATADGGAAVIPVYVYSGSDANGVAMSTWTVPALDPSNVTIPTDWAPYWFAPWGRVTPIMYSGVAPVGSGTKPLAPVNN